jgi:predicted dehydrogenase
VSIDFACGAVGTLHSNDGRSFTIPTETVELTVDGGNFMTIANSSSYRLVENGACTEWYEPPIFASSGDGGNDSGHFRELLEFVTLIRDGRRDGISTVAEGYRSMVLFEAIALSACTGEPVPVIYEEI